MEYGGIGEKNMKIMREYLKKKDAHSFKKFVAVRGEVIKVLVDNMRLWVSDKNEQILIAKEIEKKFTKENFNNLYFIDFFISTKMKDYFFKGMLVKVNKK